MRLSLVSLALLIAACSDTTTADGGVADAGGSVDAGTVDAGTVDAGTVDAGTAPMDAGSTDAAAEPDAAVLLDAGDDAGLNDAGADAGLNDAGGADAAAAMCNAGAVRFAGIARGPLTVGTLCDELTVCVNHPTEAAAVMAASSVFQCSAAPETPCASMTCSYRDPGGPSVLDAAELAEICAVTLITPTPIINCVVFAG